MKSRKNNSRYQVKICGITRSHDLDLCIRCGVDYVGLNFSKRSQRFIGVEAAKSLIRDSSFRTGAVKIAGVFVDMKPTEIRSYLDICPQISVVQLHGGETRAEVEDLRALLHSDVEIWKAVKVTQLSDINNIIEISSRVDLVLLDGSNPGSGESFNWELLADSGLGKVRWGLAGGVRLSNLPAAIKLNPNLIDIASGVESSPGVKESAKIQEVMKVVRG